MSEKITVKRMNMEALNGIMENDAKESKAKARAVALIEKLLNGENGETAVIKEMEQICFRMISGTKGGQAFLNDYAFQCFFFLAFIPKKVMWEFSEEHGDFSAKDYQWLLNQLWADGFKLRPNKKYFAK
jgi:hypothetical protein